MYKSPIMLLPKINHIELQMYSLPCQSAYKPLAPRKNFYVYIIRLLHTYICIYVRKSQVTCASTIFQNAECCKKGEFVIIPVLEV
jgi:hypothetical protein